MLTISLLFNIAIIIINCFTQDALAIRAFLAQIKPEAVAGLVCDNPAQNDFATIVMKASVHAAETLTACTIHLPPANIAFPANFTTVHVALPTIFIKAQVHFAKTLTAAATHLAVALAALAANFIEAHVAFATTFINAQVHLATNLTASLIITAKLNAPLKTENIPPINCWNIERTTSVGPITANIPAIFIIQSLVLSLNPLNLSANTVILSTKSIILGINKLPSCIPASCN